MMTAANVRDLLRNACFKEGSLRAWARKHKLSAAYVSDVLLDRRDPGPSICKAFGIEQVRGDTMYRKVKS